MIRQKPKKTSKKTKIYCYLKNKISIFATQ